MTRYSEILFARPSFLEGVARILDFRNGLNEYNTSASPERADELAFWADWCQVGEDLRGAMSAFETNPEERESSERTRSEGIDGAVVE